MSDTPTATQSSATPDDDIHCVYVLESQRQARLRPTGWFRPNDLLVTGAIAIVVVLITFATSENSG